jgi:hypothetical protein
MEANASNVQVAIRCRPLNRAELAAGNESCFRVEAGKVVLRNPADGTDYEFAFDHMYEPSQPQVMVYEDNGAPLLDKAFAGFNGTIFAYGQTGVVRCGAVTAARRRRRCVRRRRARSLQLLHRLLWILRRCAAPDLRSVARVG